MVNWYTCRKRFSIDSRFFLYFHVLVVDEYKKFEVSAWILDCATSNLMPSDAAVQSQFSWLSEDFPKGTVPESKMPFQLPNCLPTRLSEKSKSTLFEGLHYHTT
jgi:hypothetical protein